MTWTAGPLKHWLALNHSGTWGEEPTGDGDVVVLRSTEIALDGSWRIDDPAVRSVGVLDRQRKRLRSGDLVVVTSSGSAQHLGKTAIVTDEVDSLGACFANFVQRLRPTPDADSRYVWYVLNSKLAADEMANLGHTTTGLRNLNGGIIGSVTFPGPPLSEQRAIADYLDSETARMDALITSKRRMIELLDERLTSLVHHRVGQAEIGGRRRLRYVVQIERGRFSHRPRNDPRFYDGDYPFVQTGDVRGSAKWLSTHTQTLNDQGRGVSRSFPAGTVLMAIAANVGDVAITDYEVWCPDSVVGFVPSREIESEYLYYLLLSARAEINETSTENLQENTNIDRLGSLLVRVPDLEVQRQIVADLRSADSRLSGLRSHIDEQMNLLAEHRQALITAAVTGALEVPGVAA